MAAAKMNMGYDFERFESHQVRSSAKQAAPQRKIQPEEPLKKVDGKKSIQQKKRESKKARSKMAFIMIFAAVMLLAVSIHISIGAKSHELSRQIADVKAQIEVQKSENIRLSSELNSITSIGKIDDYATKILGMNKIESYQIEYIELTDGDEVLYSSNGGFLNIFN